MDSIKNTVSNEECEAPENEIDALKKALAESGINFSPNPEENKEYSEEISELSEERREARFKIWEAERTVIMRIQWSGSLRKIIWWIVIFDIIMVVGIGLNILKFAEKEHLVYLFAIESMLKIAGLAFIVVKYLFNIKKDI